MNFSYSIFSVGDQAVSLQVAGAEVSPALQELLLTMKLWIESNPFIGLRDIVVGYQSISITFDLVQIVQSGVGGNAAEFVKEELTNAYTYASQNKTQPTSRHIKIPVCYDSKFAFDGESICNRNKITPAELVQLHSGISYKVYLVGFLPGFPYLGFVDARLEVPRHSSPRKLVPAGSVGIAGLQTGIYSFDSPGGWQIIGRTPIKMFDPLVTPPVLMEAGDSVSFYPIDESEFHHLQNATR